MEKINFKKITDLFFSLAPEQKGKSFELFCKWYLENDPYYSMQLKKVWLWNEWSGKWGRDKGIDLVAETNNGLLWAIQAKAYDESYYITKEDIDTFLSESSRKVFSFRLLIATTNNIGFNAREVVSAQEKQVGLCLRDNLESSDLDWSQALKNPDEKIIINSKLPRPHQDTAINAVINGFEKSAYGQLYMACGTGKTLVGLWLAAKLQCKNTLVLVPSISLVAQLYKEWAANAGDYIFDPIFVCSDSTVGKTHDEDFVSFDSTELGFPVTTNADEILKQYSLNIRPKVIFATYHSSPIIAQACLQDPSFSFDLAIADEAHRCAGPVSSDFATIVNKDAIKTKRKLFMTATPKIFSENVKKKTQEVAYEIVSMNDEEKFGPVFYTLLFSDAIKEGLLSDYQVLISVMDDATYREYAEKGRFVKVGDHETDARTLASQLLVAKAIKKFDLKKVISFHNRKKSAQEFVTTFSKASQLLAEGEKPCISFQQTIFGEMQQSERKRILKQFENVSHESTGLLGNVKCLSEGVDVPSLDGIVFVDPKGSEIDIVQAVGRAIRKSSNKKIGTIIIPIFVDSASDEDLTLEQSCFKPIWKVVKALRAHDDVLAEELDTIRLELGKRTYKSPPKLSKISIDVPISIGASFGDSIKLKIIKNCAWILLAKSHPEIVSEWHEDKNSITPNDVTAGSHKKVWWRCAIADDHEWLASIKQRAISGNGCPMCRGSIVVKSNSLGSLNPTLSNQWHITKNGKLTPYEVHGGSHKKVWWKCAIADDHEWQATIDNRINGSGCPFCFGTKVTISNCLATVRHEIAAEWHSTKNGNLTPNDVTIGSGKKVWWKCPIADDHIWQAEIRSRTNGSQCPACLNRLVVLSNCLATINPILSTEWHPTKNKLTPFDIVPGSYLKVWWFCTKGHAWKAAICDRAKKEAGCPECYKNKL